MKYAYKGHEIRPMVEIYHDVVPYLGGITEGQFYRDAQKCAEAWKTANAAISEYFGEPGFKMLVSLDESDIGSTVEIDIYEFADDIIDDPIYMVG